MPDLVDLLKRWAFLPDDAVVPIKVVAAVTSLSERTIRYDPRFEKVWLTPNRYGYRVGPIKKILLGDWRSLGDIAARVVGGADTARRLAKVGRMVEQQQKFDAQVAAALDQIERSDSYRNASGETQVPDADELLKEICKC